MERRRIRAAVGLLGPLICCVVAQAASRYATGNPERDKLRYQRDKFEHQPHKTETDDLWLLLRIVVGGLMDKRNVVTVVGVLFFAGIIALLAWNF